MRLLDLSLASPAADLALDEALLEEAPERAASGEAASAEILRLWEFDRPVVVLGRGSRAAAEVELEYCRAAAIPILRRCSGGATVVGGPGCLMYSLVLSLVRRPELRKLDVVHQYVMQNLQAAVARCTPQVTQRGTCDLAFGPEQRKVSGNSLRLSRDYLLYHGTILYAADLFQIARCLRTAPRQPAYRQQRDHHAFLANLDVSALDVRQEIIEQFAVRRPMTEWPRQRVASLQRERYDCDAWNFRH